MTTAEPASATFETTVTATGNNTGIVVPEEVIAGLAAGRRAVDLAAALAADERAGAFFAALSNSLQRYHVDNVNAAKSPETRQRRSDKAVALFREGRQR